MRDRNIRIVNKADAAEEIKLWQLHNEFTTILPGDDVLVGLNDQGCLATEYLWVKVEEVDGNTIKGWVNNDTRLLETINYQDKVTIDRNIIKNRIPGSSLKED